jgi:hypothetical protein
MSGYSIAVSGNVPSNVPINFVTNSGTATSASNNINVFGSGAVSTSGSGNTVTITATSGVMNWFDEAVDFGAIVNEGYFCTGALTVSLPGGATQGQTVSIICATTGAIIVQADASQFIAVGAESSSLGGTATSTALGDNLILVYREASSTWWALEADATWIMA